MRVLAMVFAAAGRDPIAATVAAPRPKEARLPARKLRRLGAASAGAGGAAQHAQLRKKRRWRA
jgi:hypothetical protein